MSFSEAVKDGFDHYVKFDGRASRPAYWWWVLFTVIVYIGVYIVDGVVFDGPVLIWLAYLALLLPSLSVTIRRLHDTDRSGWWILISLVPFIGGIVLLVFVLQKSDEAENQYGPPQATAAAY